MSVPNLSRPIFVGLFHSGTKRWTDRLTCGTWPSSLTMPLAKLKTNNTRFKILAQDRIKALQVMSALYNLIHNVTGTAK